MWREREGYDEDEDWWNQPDVPSDTPPPQSDPIGDAWGVIDPPHPAPDGQQWRRNPQTGVWELLPINGYTNPTPGLRRHDPSIDRVGGSGPQGYLPGGDGGQFSALGGQNYWDSFQFPTFDGPDFSYPEFSGFQEFVQPTQDEIMADPVLQAQLTEGQKRLKADRAFRGILNTGGTLKDIFDWQTDRVKLGANDMFDRKFRMWDANNRGRFDMWAANRDLAYGRHDRNYKTSFDEFFYNQYDPAKLKFQDAYNRWKATGDWLAIPDA